MAREWRVGETLLLIEQKLASIAPLNAATIPIALAYEDGLWHVDVMVKKPTCEYDVHSEDPDLKRALKGAYMRLANWPILERQGKTH